ncbi:MAG: SDR family oxidoreductase [Candidatus Curtissbacteria bacterium]|nr:SDR family oxidoreductase [Candidatus Curtissbacteria bacterium]
MKVAVVTGSAKGLGRAIALTLADEGYTLVIHYKSSKEEAQKVLDLISKKSPKSIVVCGDLRREDEVSKIFSEVLKKLGRVDLLVNNVGDFLYKKFSETTTSEFRNLIESNLYSTLYVTRAVLPVMRKQKGGNVINLGAVGAERIQLTQKSAAYFLAKTGVYTLTKVMAHEEAKSGIRINMISPASLETDIFKPDDFPMGRCVTYEDVVKALKFLISPDATYINGANIEVAGGFIPGMS